MKGERDMGYPWGDMSYPTFEKAERNVEAFTGTFYTEYDNMLYQARQLNVLRGNAKFDGMFLVPGKHADKPVDDDTDEQDNILDGDNYDDSYPSLRQETDAFGIALARAFVAAGVDNDELDYLVRDIAAILEDRIVSTADRENGDYGENAYKHEELARNKATLADKDKLASEKKYEPIFDGQTVEEYYKSSIEKLEKETTEFENEKVAETRARCRNPKWEPGDKLTDEE